uniref:Uncharacterized protein n=1 Tax=Vitis vinifera TaxID=29760 RepID=F6HZQ3_VITVI
MLLEFSFNGWSEKWKNQQGLNRNNSYI